MSPNKKQKQEPTTGATTDATMDALAKIMNKVHAKDGHKPEFIQCVDEISQSLTPLFKQRPDLVPLFERLIEPERLIQFRVSWPDDHGVIQINRAWRVQYSSTLGPYKGGLRFHPSVTSSVLEFLGLEQILKNALTGLPLGGGKGGSDFDPKGKSDNEVMRFCQAFMSELFRHIGANVDVPAGDIGVGGREIGYLYAIQTYHGTTLRGKRCLVSGSGNVSLFCAEELIKQGGIVITFSDSNGYVYEPNGFTKDQLTKLMHLKTVTRGRLSEFPAICPGVEYYDGETPFLTGRSGRKLRTIMKGIFDTCRNAAKEYGREGDLQFGANVAGFVKVANAMQQQGLL
ncbi:hypothetical protein BASA81_012931 [Batrachochytrium salamandrivorans]|nr:hypothetical protein BASA81_012931 [Batrachochytrium salamandrivorans]